MDTALENNVRSGSPVSRSLIQRDSASPGAETGSRLWRMLRRQDLASALARGAAAAFAIQVIGTGLGYLSQILLARWMGDREFGIYTYALAWATALAVPAGLGLPVALLRFIPAYQENRQWGLLRGALRDSSWATVLAGIVFSLAATAAAVFLLIGHSAYAQSRAGYLLPVILGIWLIVPHAMINLQTQVSRALRRVTLAFGPFLVLRPFLILAGAGAMAAVGLHLNSMRAVALTGGAVIAAYVVQAIILRRDLRSSLQRAQAEFCRPEWKAVAGPLLVVSLFQMLLAQSDVLVVGSMLDARAVAFYGAASRTAGLVGFALAAVNLVVAPVISRLYARNDRPALAQLAATAARWMFWPSAAITLGLVLYGPQILTLFGTRFVEAQPVLVVLALGQLASASAGAVALLLNLTGYQKDTARVLGFSSIINIGLCVVLARLYGVVGAAAATALTTALWNGWLYLLVRRRLAIHSFAFPLIGPAIP